MKSFKKEYSKTFFLLTVLVLIILFFVIYSKHNRKIKEGFNGFNCDDGGCTTVTGSSSQFSEFDECEQQCRYNYDSDTQTCVRAEDGEYATKNICENRYNCDNEGFCRKVAGGEYSTKAECQQKCRFKYDGESRSCIIDQNGIYNTRNECENRYSCIYGNCELQAGGTYPFKRLCDRYCKSDENPNNIYLSFDKNFDLISTFDQNILKLDIKNMMVSKSSGSLTLNNITNIILINSSTYKVVLNFDFPRDKILELVNLLTKEPIVIQNLTGDYNIISVMLFGENTPMPTLQSISEIYNDNYIKIKIFSKENLRKLAVKESTISLISNPNESVSVKSQLLDNYEKTLKVISKQKILPDEIFATESVGQNRYISTNENLVDDINNENYILLEDLTEERLQEINSYEKYMDVDFIQDYVRNYNDIKILIIGNKQTEHILDYYDEFYLLIFKNYENEYKFTQIPIDLNLLYLYKIQIAKFSLFDTQEQAKQSILSRLYDQKDFNYRLKLFNSYSDTLNFSFEISVFKESQLKDILVIYEEKQLKSEKKCIFKPEGETIFNCETLCKNNSKKNNCNPTQCKELCNNCQNSSCLWTVSDDNKLGSLVPDSVYIRGFAGNKVVKLSWIRPVSRASPNKYYILVTNTRIKHFEIFVLESEEELLEYIVDGLKNGVQYNFVIFSKNRFGISNQSNIETVIPDASRLLEMNKPIDKSHYEDSIQNYYNSVAEDTGGIVIDVKKQRSLLEKQLVINDLKDQLVDKLIPKEYGLYDIKIY